MKVILERVSEASVTVDNILKGQIALGYLLLVGFTHTDTKEIAAKMAEKITNLRIMPDEDDKMNKSISEAKGKILAVPQFTLYADTSGRRPGFKDAARPENAKNLFDYFVEQLKLQKLEIEQGVFGAHMIVMSKNDGPLTLQLEMLVPPGGIEPPFTA